jgi:hypothetical protein
MVCQNFCYSVFKELRRSFSLVRLSCGEKFYTQTTSWSQIFFHIFLNYFIDFSAINLASRPLKISFALEAMSPSVLAKCSGRKVLVFGACGEMSKVVFYVIFFDWIS